MVFLASINATGNVDWATYFGQSDGSTSIFKIMSSVDNLGNNWGYSIIHIPMVNAFQP
jgi:hypothetical protein